MECVLRVPSDAYPVCSPTTSMRRLVSPGHGASSCPRQTLERARKGLCVRSHDPIVTVCRLPITGTSKLGVTGTQTQHMAV